MSDKIELEVVATFDGLYIIPLVALERGTDLCRLADTKRFIRAALAKQPAPAAPVAVHAPGRELIGYACDRRGALIPDRCGDCLCWPAYEDAPPAAEQPECGCCGQTGPCDPDCDCAKQHDKLAEMETAEQPDTLRVPRELAETIASFDHTGVIDRATLRVIFIQHYAALGKLRALLAGGDKP